MAVAGAAAAAPVGPHVSPRAGDVPKPKIDWDPIPYGKNRKRQMANYSHRH